MFEAEDTDLETIQTLIINRDEEVRYVSMGIRGGLKLAGLMLLNEELDILAYEHWYKLNSLGASLEWTPLQEIPPGQRIIGVKCYEGSKSSGAIFHLSFLLGLNEGNRVIGQIDFP